MVKINLAPRNDENDLHSHSNEQIAQPASIFGQTHRNRLYLMKIIPAPRNDENDLH